MDQKFISFPRYIYISIYSFFFCSQYVPVNQKTKLQNKMPRKRKSGPGTATVARNSFYKDVPCHRAYRARVKNALPSASNLIGRPNSAALPKKASGPQQQPAHPSRTDHS